MLSGMTLIPGKLDPIAERIFTRGACGGLAIVLHEETGWPIVAITDSHNVHEGHAGGGSALHWTVRRPDGKLIDVDGAHEAADLVAEYEAEADDGEAAWGLSCREDALEWYECQGCPVSLEVARTFVIPVLARARG